MAGILLYIFRLNAPTHKRIDEILAEALPCDLDPSRTISMPIRASDKCTGDLHIGGGWRGESTCLNFTEYMELAETIRKYDPQVRLVAAITRRRDCTVI